MLGYEMWRSLDSGMSTETDSRKLKIHGLHAPLSKKSNDMNVDTGVKAIGPALIFAALPKASAEGLVSCSLAFGLLYILEDTIPNEAN